MFHVPEKYRLKNPVGLKHLASTEADGTIGIFHIPHYKIHRYMFYCQVSDGDGWEHVSVSVGERNKAQKRCPTWGEMCWIKDQFWGKEDRVVQFHPPASEYVSCHPFVLHLWRPIGVELPHPDSIMVGPPTSIKDIKSRTLKAAVALREIILIRTRKAPEKYACPRAKSMHSPCVCRDGELAKADDGMCVGCGVDAVELLEAELEKL